MQDDEKKKKSQPLHLNAAVTHAELRLLTSCQEGDKHLFPPEDSDPNAFIEGQEDGLQGRTAGPPCPSVMLEHESSGHPPPASGVSASPASYTAAPTGRSRRVASKRNTRRDASRSAARRNASPMPLNQVPRSCGYDMQKNPLGLVLLVPYDGCNVAQEGGSYVLPMRWQGIPVLLWCRKPAAASPSTAAQQNPQQQTPRHPPPYPSVMPPQPHVMPPHVLPPHVMPPLSPHVMLPSPYVPPQGLPQEVPNLMERMLHFKLPIPPIVPQVPSHSNLQEPPQSQPQVPTAMPPQAQPHPQAQPQSYTQAPTAIPPQAQPQSFPQMQPQSFPQIQPQVEVTFSQCVGREFQSFSGVVNLLQLLPQLLPNKTHNSRRPITLHHTPV
ncbi:hypothetical protein EYF80_052751 [Liparis tanakae]|uniref:Uncharacterized protein n=1 Tax=Liparis tanakae TaxID=230148 RepID=A0A4Z2F7B0_9TELE|nr:hypothetical protein EYF80_052751 [Liparis tanakae]